MTDVPHRSPAGRLRSLSLLLGVLLAATALLAWSQPWFVVVLGGDSATHAPIAAAGAVAAPAVAALAIAGLAGFGAMAISGPIFRFILALLHVVVGGSIALSAVLALVSPVASVEPLVTAATGIAGRAAVTQLIATVSATAWPWVALAAGVLLAVLGVVIMFTGRAWPGSTRRYQSVRFAPAESRAGSDRAVSDWDVLSDGGDPTARASVEGRDLQ